MSHNYTAMFDTIDDSLPVPRIEFTVASDKMAIEFASKTLTAYARVGYIFKRCTVFRVPSPDGEGDTAHVASILLKLGADRIDHLQ